MVLNHELTVRTQFITGRKLDIKIVIIFHNKTEYVNKMATYPKIQKLGAGAFGEVWKVERDPPNGVWNYAAMKIIKVVEELGII